MEIKPSKRPASPRTKSSYEGAAGAVYLQSNKEQGPTAHILDDQTDGFIVGAKDGG